MSELQAWLIFGFLVAVLLTLDLAVFNRRAHVFSMREAVRWSIFWVALALLFNAGVYALWGTQRATDFLTGYLVEKSLSVDNLFVISVIFTYFRVPPKHQHRVLFWGIIGALVCRGLFVFLGVEMMHRFAWMTYVLGGFLVYTGIKLLSPGDEADEVGNNALVRLAQRHFRFTSEYADGHFFTRVDGRLCGTPLLLVVIVIETTDVLFAVDSVPAVLGITTDAFVVYTSNVFAILGLRALYFVLADAVLRFHFMKHGLCLILSFVGVKMLIVPWLHIPTAASLGVISTTLAITAAMSLALERQLERERERWRQGHSLAGVEVASAEEPPLAQPPEIARFTRLNEAPGERATEDIEKLMLLHMIPSFRGVPLEELRPLVSDLHLLRIRSGEYVFHQGDPGEAVYVVVEGEVVIERTHEDWGASEVAIVGTSQHFGEMALFDGRPRSASARARGETLLLALLREPFLNVSRRHPQILVELIRTLSSRLRSADEVRYEETHRKR